MAGEEKDRERRAMEKKYEDATTMADMAKTTIGTSIYRLGESGVELTRHSTLAPSAALVDAAPLTLLIIIDFSHLTLFFINFINLFILFFY